MNPNVSDHEQTLFSYFGKTPERCVMDSRLPGKGVFVLFSNRCGSNHFVDLLNQLPTVRLQHEVFNAEMVMKHCEDQGLTTFSDYIRYLRTLKKEVPAWGAKVGAVQLDMLCRFGLMQAFEEGTYIIWLKRKDVVAQAVSHYVASTTLQWTSFQKEAAPPPAYNFKKIAGFVRAIIQNNAAAETNLALAGLNFFGLWYEDFVSGPNYHMRRVAGFLDEPFAHLKLEGGRHKRQEDSLKADYAARFTEEAREHLAIGTDPYGAESPIWKSLEK